MDSIFAQLGALSHKVEVVVSDNHSSENTWTICLEMSQKFDNLRVIRTPHLVSGDWNAGFALRHGTGVFLKLLSDNSKVHYGEIRRLLDLVEFYSEQELRPAIFFHYASSNIHCKHLSLEKFIGEVVYWPSAIGSFSCWKDDFVKYYSDWQYHEKYLAHYSCMLLQVERRGALIYPGIFSTIIPKGMKGGYHFNNVFIDNQRELLTRHVLNGSLSDATAKKVIRQTVFKHCSRWHARTLVQYKSAFQLAEVIPDSELLTFSDKLLYYKNVFFYLIVFLPCSIFKRRMQGKKPSFYGDEFDV